MPRYRSNFSPRIGTLIKAADCLVFGRVMRQFVGGRSVDAQAASPSQIERFYTEMLAPPENGASLADLNGAWIDRTGSMTATDLSTSYWILTVRSARADTA